MSNQIKNVGSHLILPIYRELRIEEIETPETLLNDGFLSEDLLLEIDSLNFVNLVTKSPLKTRSQISSQLVESDHLIAITYLGTSSCLDILEFGLSLGADVIFLVSRTNQKILTADKFFNQIYFGCDIFTIVEYRNYRKHIDNFYKIL